jgi:hypothetical protein
VARSSDKVLILAARQSDFAALLEEDGFEVELRTRPLEDAGAIEADVAVVFRGRLIGRNQTASLSAAGIPVVEVLTVDPPGTSNATWVRVSNRVQKPDLVQIVHAVADWARVKSETGADDALAPAAGDARSLGARAQA